MVELRPNLHKDISDLVNSAVLGWKRRNEKRDYHIPINNDSFFSKSTEYKKILDDKGYGGEEYFYRYAGYKKDGSVMLASPNEFMTPREALNSLVSEEITITHIIQYDNRYVREDGSYTYNAVTVYKVEGFKVDFGSRMVNYLKQILKKFRKPKEEKKIDFTFKKTLDYLVQSNNDDDIKPNVSQDETSHDRDLDYPIIAPGGYPDDNADDSDDDNYHNK